MSNKSKRDFKEEIMYWPNCPYVCCLSGGLVGCCTGHLTVTFGRKEPEAKCSVGLECPEDIVLHKQTNKVSSLETLLSFC